MAWTFPIIVASSVLVSSHTDVALLVIFILPAIFYLAIPVSFRLALVSGISCSLATLTVYLSSHPLSEIRLGMVLGTLMCNVVLALVLRQYNRLQRLEWSATQAQRAANDELSKHRDMLQKILQDVPIPLIILDKNSGKLIQANDAASNYFGSDLLNGSLKIEDCIDHRNWENLAMRLQSKGNASGFETRISLPDSPARDVLLAATSVVVSGNEALLTIFIDITRRKEAEAMMEKLANTDPLSGLPNRTHFFTIAVEEIKRAERYHRPLAVFMVDIDFFKLVNDTYGHEAGDLVLKAFAELCRTWVRHQDIVARLGGEEFSFLLPETDTLHAMALADRLRAAVEGLRIDKILTPITISIGVSEVLPGEMTVDAALSRADQALYAAKREGRNQVILYDRAEADSMSAEYR